LYQLVVYDTHWLQVFTKRNPPAAPFFAAKALERTREKVVDEEYATDIEREEICGGIEGDNPDKGRFDPDSVLPQPTPLNQPLSRKQKRDMRSKRKCNEGRMEEMAISDGLKRHVRRKRDDTFKNPRKVNILMEKDLEPTKPGWIGKRDGKKNGDELPPQKDDELPWWEELMAQGFEYINFRGKYAYSLFLISKITAHPFS